MQSSINATAGESCEKQQLRSGDYVILTLRPDQIEATEKLRQVFLQGKRAPLLQAATGWGKTVWFSSIAKSASEKGKRVFILCHRTELVDQISETLHQFDVQHGYIASGYGSNPFAGTQVCSVFTLIHRLNKVPRPDLIIIDESHHGIKNSTWGKIINYYQNVLRIGVTATPTRTNGEPLGDLFDSMILTPSVRSLMDAGVLSDYRLFTPTRVVLRGVRKRMGDYVASDLAEIMDKPTIIGDAISTYRQYACGKKAVVFSVSVQHAHHTAEAFQAAGFNSTVLDGELEKHERRLRVERFRRGEIQVIVSCDILNEGFDVKGIECGIFLRPTQSLTLWLQQVGRCLRAMPGKDHALLFDHANNAFTHGLPDDEREWTLDGSSSSHQEKQKILIRQCTKCYAVVPLAARECKWCGFMFPIKPREVEMVEGELQELSETQRLAMQAKRDARREQGMSNSYEALLKIEKQRGYKPGWARHVLNARRARGSTSKYGDGLPQEHEANGHWGRHALSRIADSFRPKK